MDNAHIIAVGVLLLVMVIASYLLGCVDGKRTGIWEERAEHNAMIARVRDEEAEWHRQMVPIIRDASFARAAQAVGLWPHRVNKRAALMRHLEALATAPELGAATPTPEATAVEASEVLDTPAPSAAPVLTVPIGADHPLGFESGAEGRIDSMEGFL